MKSWITTFCLLLWLAANSALAESVTDAIAQAMDTSADPCQDFYRYACGGWTDNTTLTDDQLQQLKGFDSADQDVQQRLYGLMQSAAESYPSDNAQQDEIGAFYKSCLNDNLQSESLTPLQPYLDAIDAIVDETDFMHVAGQLRAIGVTGLLNTDIRPDLFSAPSYGFVVSAGDPGSYDGDIYNQRNRYNNRLRLASETDIKSALTLLGESADDAARHSRQIMAIETVLSKHHALFGKIKDLDHYGSPMTLDWYPPYFPWSAYFDAMGAQNISAMYASPSFLKALAKIVRKTPTDGLKAYLRWSLISSYRAYLPKAYAASAFSNQIVALSDAPRWQTCVKATSLLLGDKVGKLLAANEAYQPVATLAQTIFNHVDSQFASNLLTVGWLNDYARIATQTKLNALTLQFAYPESWPDFTPLSLNDGDYLGNVVAAQADSLQRGLARYGQMVNRNTWEFDSVPPQQVNAFYDLQKNQIHFLAGLLRKPFLDPDYPDAINYGGVGFVAAHELMHGYGDAGRYFLETGGIGLLWPKAVNKKFTQRSLCVVNQYQRYKIPGQQQKIKSKPTLEENLADVNGLKLAYQTFMASADSSSQYTIGNTTLSAEQLFFVSFAQTFCSVNRPEVDYYQHTRSWSLYAPERYRVIGPLSNRPEFAAAFNCPANSPMNPRRKCEIW